MEKVLVMKIKKGDIEVEVQGNCEEVKEQFITAVEAVKDIHQMQTETNEKHYDEVTDKLIGPLMAMLKE